MESLLADYVATDSKADVSSVSPSSEQIEELWVVCGLYTEGGDNRMSQQDGQTPATSCANEFIFYLRISQYSNVIYFVYHFQTYHKTKSGTQR